MSQNDITPFVRPISMYLNRIQTSQSNIIIDILRYRSSIDGIQRTLGELLCFKKKKKNVKIDSHHNNRMDHMLYLHLLAQHFICDKIQAKYIGTCVGSSFGS